MSEPMSDERLAEIRQHNTFEFHGSSWAVEDITALLAEVERLRAREAALVALARAVASGEELHPNWREQARGWLQAEGEGDGE